MGFIGSIEYLIPSRDLTWHIQESLDSVLISAWTQPSNFHIFFDGSGVPPRSEVLTKAFQDRVRISSWPGDCDSRGPAAVRNILAANSEADYFVFVDSDVTLTPHFDSNLRQYLAQAGTEGIVYPRILGRKAKGHVSHFFQEHVMSPKIFRSGALGITSAVFGIAADTWRRLPNFDERYHSAGGEDWQFFRDIQTPPHNVQIHFSESLVCHHENPKALDVLIQRATRYGLQAHLHTPPPPEKMDRWKNKTPPILDCRRVSRFLAQSLYRLLLGVNRGLARLPRLGPMGLSLAEVLVRVRDRGFLLARKLRQNRPERDSSGDHLLMVERVRYSSLVSRFFPKETEVPDSASHTPSNRETKAPTPVALADPFSGRGRIIHSEKHHLGRVIPFLAIRLLWSRAYWRSWREGAVLDTTS